MHNHSDTLITPSMQYEEIENVEMSVICPRRCEQLRRTDKSNAEDKRNI